MSDAQTDPKCKVHFLPDDIAVTVNKGANLLSAALAAGVHINASCGGSGECYTCKVKITSGMVDSKSKEALNVDEYDQGIRLACRSLILSDLTVVIPPESRLDKSVPADERRKAAGISAAGWKYNPPLKKIYLELPPATLKDNANDLFRLMWGLKQSYDMYDVPINFDVIRKLPFALRQNSWKVTATTSIISSRPHTKTRITPKLINVESGDARDRLYVLTVDIGTTTLCAQLLDLARGKVAAETVTLNRQTDFGETVAERIEYSQQPGALRKLQEALIASINAALDTLIDLSGVPREDICHITTAGNPTMQHLLLGLDPKYIRLSPYTPNANFVPSVKATTLGLNVGEHVYVFTFPAISGFVGGDIIAGVTACGMHQTRKLTLYIDIGTNGEIVIGNSEWMLAASSSAGQVLEGRALKHGMMAVKGAVQNFRLDPKTLGPQIETIGGGKPAGICGAGLIQIVSELLKYGIIGTDGKISRASPAPGITRSEEGLEYVLALARDTETGRDIVITETDIAALIRAKAAIYAACQTLTRSANISFSDFQQVLLAGIPGDGLDIRSAINIGLLPDLPVNKFTFIGNASLTGLRLVNYSNDMLNASRNVAQMMTNLELNDNADFSYSYKAALVLPQVDAKKSPSISQKLRTGKKPLK